MKIKNQYEAFCKQMNDYDLDKVAKSYDNIFYNFDDGGFFLWARDCRSNEKSVVVFDSDGMADVTYSSDQVRKYLMDDADGALEVVRYDDRFEA